MDLFAGCCGLATDAVDPTAKYGDNPNIVIQVPIGDAKNDAKTNELLIHSTFVCLLQQDIYSHCYLDPKVFGDFYSRLPFRYFTLETTPQPVVYYRYGDKTRFVCGPTDTPPATYTIVSGLGTHGTQGLTQPYRVTVTQSSYLAGSNEPHLKQKWAYSFEDVSSSGTCVLSVAYFGSVLDKKALTKMMTKLTMFVGSNYAAIVERSPLDFYQKVSDQPWGVDVEESAPPKYPNEGSYSQMQ